MLSDGAQYKHAEKKKDFIFVIFFLFFIILYFLFLGFQTSKQKHIVCCKVASDLFLTGV